MKIAYPSMTGERISGHPGRAKYLVIVEVENNEIKNKKVIENPIRHHDDKNQPIPKEKQNWSVIKNIDLFITRRCGEGFIRKMEKMGKELIITEEKDINNFVKNLQLR